MLLAGILEWKGSATVAKGGSRYLLPLDMATRLYLGYPPTQSLCLTSSAWESIDRLKDRSPCSPFLGFHKNKQLRPEDLDMHNTGLP